MDLTRLPLVRWRLFRLGEERAASHEIRDATGVWIYTGIAFMLGSGFDEDPLLPWAAAVLGEENRETRAARLHERALVFLNEVGLRGAS